MSDVGQMMLVRTSGFLSAAIRYFTKSEYNHTTNLVGDIWYEGKFYPDAVISAEGSGVKIMKRSDFPNSVVSDFPMSEAQQMKAMAFSINAIGAKYARLAFVMIWISLITKRATPRWIERYLVSSKHYICSQLSDSAFHAAGIRLFRHVVPSAVTPAMFVPLYVDAGWLPEGTR